ncbi:MAG: hypothetical protein FWD11_11995, partial [Micrococcales bacterium]|nr:hypothetical protein [Micrococcales bacterium]
SRSVDVPDQPVVTDPTGKTAKVRTLAYYETDRWSFESAAAGSYKVTAPEGGSTIEVGLTHSAGSVPGVTGLLLLFVAGGLGMVAVGLVIAGSIWWSGRAKNATKVAQTAPYEDGIQDAPGP